MATIDVDKIHVQRGMRQKHLHSLLCTSAHYTIKFSTSDFMTSFATLLSAILDLLFIYFFRGETRAERNGIGAEIQKSRPMSQHP
jgi:hypothetical protein